ncbi:MAG TPA: IS21 family transposase [Streptosporangiaceae bacterium]|nr:IS21 family transposase [Streptosporangiaceae bacterium]
MITLDEWAEIRRLHRSEHLGIKAIARKLGISKNTVRRALRSEEVPRYSRPPKGSIADPAEPAIREQLRLCPTMPATVVAERIGWERSITVLRERVAELRPLYLPQDPAGRTSYEPGQRAQNDFWFPPAEVPLGPGTVASGDGMPPVLVMASGYSRWMLGLMIPSRHAEDLVLGTWQLLQQLGGVPKQLVWDNEGGVGKYRGQGRPPKLSAQFAEFRGLLGCEVKVLPPREPEHKGIVERNNDYLETSFLPGRSFTSPADFNVQLGEWTLLANSRVKRVLGCAPADRIAADRAAMAPLPPLSEQSLGWHNRIRLPRDHYVRIDTCDYSVDPSVIGRHVDVRADLTQVTVRCDGRLVACHDRSWVAHQTVTDPEHKAAADVMRAARLREKLAAPAAVVEVEQRDLSRYDALLGGGEVA